MKLAAALLITLAGTLLGRYASNLSVKKCESAENVLLMLSSIRSRLEFMCLPVYELIDALCAEESLKTLEFIELCKEKCICGEPFPAAWESSVKASAKRCFLSGSDAVRLCEFGHSMGTTDLKSQLAVCEMYSAIFGKKLEEYTAAKKKFTGVLAPLGFLGGLAVSVLLI